jgi:glycoside/pentoside/hexuronide:cation symporter, GPH family
MIRKHTMFYYGFLAMPMAFIALYLFIFIPVIYHQQYGIPITKIITVFIITKLINFAAMPYIGIYLDKLNLKRIYRKKIIYVCLPLIALSFNFLIFPPFESEISMVLFYLITCLLYSFIMINYYAMSVEIAPDYKAQNYLAGYREAFTIAGFMLAAFLSTILTKKYQFEEAYNNIIFILTFMLFSAGVLLHFIKSKLSFLFHPELTLKKLLEIARRPKIKIALLSMFINNTAIALSLTTNLIFIKYVLKAEDLTGSYLMVYYLCGIISIPFWVKFSNKHGKKYSFISSMLAGALFLFSAFLLGEGDRMEYYIICIATGLCLGADLVLPPSMFSDNVEKREKAGVHYSLWILLSKVAMTIGVLVSLNIVYVFGLEASALISQSEFNHATNTISTVHTLIPAILKIIAVFILLRAGIDVKFNRRA